MPKTSHPAYRPDIDGLRAIAVLAVVLFHAFPSQITGGFIGVDIFFVISGFLISTILMKEHEAGRFSYAGFYARRIRRIFPALILVLAFCWILGWFSLFADEFAQLGKHIAGGGLFSANLVFWSEAGYFDQASEQKLLLHLWSLGIEEQFYILWPILLGLLWKPRWTAIGMAALLGLSFLANIMLTGYNQTAAFYFPLSRFWELLAGALLAWTQLHRPLLLQQQTNLQSVSGLVLLVMGFCCIRGSSAFPGYWALLPVLGSVLLISAGPDALLNRYLFGNKLMVGIGLISYPLYLWHWPVMAFIRISKDGELTRPWALRAIAVSFLLAWLTYRFVEKPFRSGRLPAKKIMGLSLAMALVVATGFMTALANGFPERKAATVVSKHLLDETRPQQYASDGSCRRQLGISESAIASAICLTTTHQPAYVIMGDSHGISLIRAAVEGEIQLDAAFIGQNGCLPFLDYQARLAGKKSDALKCQQAVQTALAYVQAPHVKTVILVTRGPGYFSGSGFGTEGPNEWRLYDNQDRMVDAPRAFVEGYATTIKHLQEARKQVIFMIDWPELGMDPKSCVGSRLLSIGRRIEKSDCTNNRDIIDKRQSVYRQLIAEIETMRPGLDVYDPTPLFCNKLVCRGRIGDQVLYSDDDHLSLSGSRMIIADLLEWQKQPKETPSGQP